MSEKHRVYCYSPDDDRLFMYDFTDEMIQENSAIFARDIWFYLSSDEFDEYLSSLTPEQRDNLKKDFIWFQPGVNRRHVMQCTCGNFLESGHNMDKLAKLAVKHHQRTGHTLHPRGN